MVLSLELRVLERTLLGSYCTRVGQLYCGLSGVCYWEHYVEDNVQEVDSVTVATMECVIVNIM